MRSFSISEAVWFTDALAFLTALKALSVKFCAIMVLVPADATNTIEKTIPIRKYSFFMREKSSELGFKLHVSRS